MTTRREVNQIPYELPSQLEKTISDFAEYYNFHRYYKSLGNVIPADVLSGIREQMLGHRKEVTVKTVQYQEDFSRNLRNLLLPCIQRKK